MVNWEKLTTQKQKPNNILVNMQQKNKYTNNFKLDNNKKKDANKGCQQKNS